MIGGDILLEIPRNHLNVGTIDYKILKYLVHHLFQRQLKYPLKYHEKHPKAQRLLLLSMESG